MNAAIKELMDRIDSSDSSLTRALLLDDLVKEIESIQKGAVVNTENPTIEGYYWFTRDDIAPEIVLVWHNGRNWGYNDTDGYSCPMPVAATAKWSGPLMEPNWKS